MFLDVNNLTPFTLNHDLGTLTLGWVVPLADTKLTPGARFPAFYTDCKFGVERGAEKFPSRDS